MTAVKYEPPEINLELTKDEIHKRYQDTAMLIYQEQQNNRDMMNYLTFGTSRRTVEYSNYGNEPVIIRRPPPPPPATVAVTQFDSGNVATRLLKLYRKPSRENCTIT